MLKMVLLAGVSIMAVAGTQAHASTSFTYTGAAQVWTAPSTGVYKVDVWGASGGGTSYYGHVGGRGIGVEARLHINAGDQVAVYIGGQGQSAAYAAGGGGGSIFFDGSTASWVGAGGGGGAGFTTDGIDASPVSFCGLGSAGIGVSGGLGAGAAGYCGGGGLGYNGGGGFGNGPGPFAGKGFVIGGGSGGLGNDGGGNGGFGAGGGGGGTYYGGGGGGGVSGGGGGGENGAGGGGGSYSLDLGAPNPGRTLGYNVGNGYVEVSAVPEPSTWSLMLSGFGFLGYVLRRRLTRTA